MRNETEPKWQITDTWGIGINPLNWCLYERNYIIKKKTGDPGYTAWKITAYFPTLEMLLKGIIDDIMLADTNATTFKEHLEQALRDATEAVEAIKKIMLEVGIGLTTYPPGYAKFTEEKEVTAHGTG